MHNKPAIVIIYPITDIYNRLKYHCSLSETLDIQIRLIRKIRLFRKNTVFFK